MNKRELQGLLGTKIRKSEWAHRIRAHNICLYYLPLVERGIETLDELGLEIDEFHVGELDPDRLPPTWHEAAKRGTDGRSNLKCLIYTLYHMRPRCPHIPFRDATLSEALALMNDAITFGGAITMEQASQTTHNPIKQKISELLGRDV